MTDRTTISVASKSRRPDWRRPLKMMRNSWATSRVTSAWIASVARQIFSLTSNSKTEGQPSHTREVKLGCIFTQTSWDEEGYPIRDPDFTTYTGAIETAEEFGKRIYVEAWKRGWSRAAKKVVMGDDPGGMIYVAHRPAPRACHFVRDVIP